MNSVWTGKFFQSYEFLSMLVKYNPSTGLFSNDRNELIAWCIQLDIGSLGGLQIDEKFYRKGLGTAIVLAQAKKIAQQGHQLTTHVVHKNLTSLSVCRKLGIQLIDTNSWIGVKVKGYQSIVPLWGHL